MQKSWLAAHIYSPEPLNVVLTGLVIPFINQFEGMLGQPSPYFFIRYWQGGSHVRLRLNVARKHTDFVKDALKSAVVLFNKNKVSAAHYLLDKSNRLLLNFEPYLPETDRYGDADSLPLAEHLFYLSSQYVLRWISESKPGASLLIESVRMHLIFLYANFRDARQIKTLCISFINGWLGRLYQLGKSESEQRIQYLTAFEKSFGQTKNIILPAFKIFWEQMAAGTADERSSRYLNGCKQIAAQYHSIRFSEEKTRAISASIMHMTNNRLGISNYEEAYGMYCTLQCLHYILKNTDYIYHD